MKYYLIKSSYMSEDGKRWFSGFIIVGEEDFRKAKQWSWQNPSVAFRRSLEDGSSVMVTAKKLYSDLEKSIELDKGTFKTIQKVLGDIYGDDTFYKLLLNYGLDKKAGEWGKIEDK